jgi:heme/copper-type cytochrome/quinol oxidase subunit 2
MIKLKAKSLRYVKVCLLVSALFAGLLWASPARAATCGKKGTETFWDFGCAAGEDGITGVLMSLLNWMAIGVTIVVIGGIIYGAILYTSSGGNQEQAKKAIGIIRSAIIALILYFGMWSILNFLVPGGLFSP